MAEQEYTLVHTIDSKVTTVVVGSYRDIVRAFVEAARIAQTAAWIPAEVEAVPEANDHGSHWHIPSHAGIERRTVNLATVTYVQPADVR